MSALADTSRRLKSALNKWPGLFARLALVFHLIEASAGIVTDLLTLSEATAARTAAFMLDILLPHALRADLVMYGTEATGHVTWIAGHILARYEGKDRITIRDVVRAYGALRAPEHRAELTAVMANLVHLGSLEPEASTNATREISAWSVNPRVHEMFAGRAAAEQAQRDEVRAQIKAAAAQRS